MRPAFVSQNSRSPHSAELIGRSIARIEKAFAGRTAARNLALFSLLAAPPISFLWIALRPNPRQIWAMRWPTITFLGLYQIALDRCVEIEGMENLPDHGPVILAGNHINKTAMDGMLLGSKILTQRGVPAKWVSIADPPSWMLRHFVRVMGQAEGALLPVHKGMTTTKMVEFIQNPEAFQRHQPILGIFPVGDSDRDFQKHMSKTWHTSAAVAAVETGAPIVPFFMDGLPYEWGPVDMLKCVAQTLAGGKPFKFRVRLGSQIQPPNLKTDDNYKAVMEQVRQAVVTLSA
jgi:1-acyl-sn-glycerol-3-phosphate acyltransferase